MEETKEHYETVCQTRYVQVNMTENKITCEMKNQEMCMPEGSDNCVVFQKRVSTVLFL